MNTSALTRAALLELHRTWFGSLAGLLDSGWADEDHRQRWFTADPAFDEQLRLAFAALPEALASADDTPPTDARELLCRILVADQLPRNLYRGTARAFSLDHSARQMALAGLDTAAEQALTRDERAFFYMPLMHAESVEDQERSLECFARLHASTPRGYRHLTGGYLRAAQLHHRLIREFGRFPHRNRVLGRASTLAETHWLQHNASRFGQSAQPAAR